MIGDIIFVRSKSPISWLIRKLTKSKWSHVAVKLSDNYLIESNFLKSVKVRKNRHKYQKVAPLYITDSERLEFVSFLIEQSHRKYDYGRIVGILFNIIGLSKNKDLWNNYNKDICSELLVRGFTHLNSDNLPREILDAITPQDIAEVLLKEKLIDY